MIRFEDVHAGFGQLLVLKGIDFQAQAGRITALVGPSGSGKSTVLKLLMGFHSPISGNIIVDGEDVSNASERQWKKIRLKMGMVFQSSALFDSLTVAQNVGFYPHYVERKPWAKIKAEVMDLLEDVGLSGNHEKYPDELSGGMRRRVALARSLIYRPKILLYDEPTTGLDPNMIGVVNELIEEMNEKYGVTSIVVSHDLDCIHAVADHVVLICDGESRVVGKPQDLLSSDDELVVRFTSSWRSHVLEYAREMEDIG